MNKSQNLCITCFCLFFFCLTPNVMAGGPDAELVYQETRIQVNNGNLIKDESFQIKINNRSGEKYTKVQIPYSSMIKVSDIKAFISDKYGRVVKKLQKKDIRDRNILTEGAFHEDYFIREFSLKHTIYPYTLTYSYEVREDQFLYLDVWNPVMDPDIPTHKALLSVEVPGDYRIYFSDHDIDGFSADTAGIVHKYSWEASYTHQVKEELFGPPLEEFMPVVKVVPAKFRYDIEGRSDSWADFGKFDYLLAEGLSSLPEKETSKINSLIKGIDDEKQKIRVLYHYLQDETRYINISLETGGLKPHSASYVAENKYGDCKALTNYFRSVLEYVGLPSYYTSVRAGNAIEKIDPDMPSQQFNHVILFVPLSDDTLWLDCTSNGPFNYLGTFTQNRFALIHDEDSSHLLRTPALQDEDVLETRSVHCRYDGESGSKATFNHTYRGENFEMLNYFAQSYDESDKDRVIRKYFLQKGFDVDVYKLTSACRDSLYISLSYTGKSHNSYTPYGNEIIIHVLPLDIPKMEKPGERKLPVQIDYPVYEADTLSYEIPSGYRVSNDLPDRTIENKFGRYQLRFMPGKDRVVIVKSILIHAGCWSKDEYPDFYDFILQAVNSEIGLNILTDKHD